MELGTNLMSQKGNSMEQAAQQILHRGCRYCSTRNYHYQGAGTRIQTLR